MNGSLQEAFDPEWFRRQGHQIVDQLADALEQTRNGKGAVRSPQSPEESVELWKKVLDNPETPESLVAKVLETTFRCHHPNNLGHQVGPVLPLAALTDLVGSLLDTGNGVFEVGNPATPMEHVFLRRRKIPTSLLPRKRTIYGNRIKVTNGGIPRDAPSNAPAPCSFCAPLRCFRLGKTAFLKVTLTGLSR